MFNVHANVTKLIIGVIMSFVSIHSALAQDLSSLIKKGTQYESARQFLISKGFRPLPLSTETEAVEERCGFRDDVCSRYPETVSCSSAGLAPCKFVFYKGIDQFIEIVTYGEEAEDLRVRSATAAQEEQKKEYLIALAEYETKQVVAKVMNGAGVKHAECVTILAVAMACTSRDDLKSKYQSKINVSMRLADGLLSSQGMTKSDIINIMDKAKNRYFIQKMQSDCLNFDLIKPEFNECSK